MQRSKAESYIGFCRKAGKLTCGFNAVEVQKKGVYLLLLCGGASENAKKSAQKLAGRFACELLVPKAKPLAELVGKENCRLAAVRDEGLAKAILSCAEDEFIKYPGGNGQEIWRQK